MSDIEQAIRCFEEGFSCSQSVLGAYAERYGLRRDLALRLGDALGGGMGGLGKTCGAVTGAMMVIGLAHGRTVADDPAAKFATKQRVQQLVARFEARHGTVVCRDLIGCAIDTPEKIRAAHDSGVFDRVCVGLIRSAAEILEEVLAAALPEA
ncbi:MAG: C_GCAxxG_C_C family protein [Deltaproteobacteria bacterium]|nr:C_GCAxxG_C_C family protein [Deltaproteobacteria bacterium]